MPDNSNTIRGEEDAAEYAGVPLPPPKTPTSSTNRRMSGFSNPNKRRSSLLSSTADPATVFRNQLFSDDGIVDSTSFTLGRHDEESTTPKSRRISGLKDTLPSIRTPRTSNLAERASQSVWWRALVAVLLGSVLVLMVTIVSTHLDRLHLRSKQDNSSLTTGTGIHYHSLLQSLGVTQYELIPNLVRDNMVQIRRALASRSRDEGDANHQVLTLRIDNDDVVLDLNRADDLYDPQYTEVRIHPNGTRSFSKDAESKSCIFHAKVRESNAFGTVSLCNGTIEAAIFRANRSFTIKPLDRNMHVAIFDEHHDTSHVCFETDEYFDYYTNSSSSRAHSRRVQASTFPVSKRNKTLRVLIVNDAARTLTFTSSPLTVEEDTASLIDLVRGIYGQMYSDSNYGVNVVLVGQISFMGTDGWPTANSLASPTEVDAQTLLNDFFTWKLSATLPQADLVHLFSGRDFVGSSAGKASQGGVCQPRNVGVDQIKNYWPTVYSKIVAHEMAHGLSLSHDNTYADTACTSNGNTYVWPSVSVVGGTSWSRCSLDALKDFFAGKSPYPYLGCLETDLASVGVAPTQQSTFSKSPTTASLSSRVPTSASPITSSPFTKSPSSVAPTLLSTGSPFSATPSSRVPTSASPITNSPFTKSPTSLAPTLLATTSPFSTSPSSRVPTSVSPTPQPSFTTNSPFTQAPSVQVTGSPFSKIPTVQITSSPSSKTPTVQLTFAPSSKSPSMQVTNSPSSKAPTVQFTASPLPKSPSSKSPVSSTNVPSSALPTKNDPNSNISATSAASETSTPQVAVLAGAAAGAFVLVGAAAIFATFRRFRQRPHPSSAKSKQHTRVVALEGRGGSLLFRSSPVKKVRKSNLMPSDLVVATDRATGGDGEPPPKPGADDSTFSPLFHEIKVNLLTPKQ